jgi:hypothetical protein
MSDAQAAPETQGVTTELLGTVDLGPEIEGMEGRELFATDHGPGLGWPENRDTVHWLENRGTTTAVEISVDVDRRD